MARTPRELKERMVIRGFQPAGEEASPEDRTAHALEFIAFYLERIDRHLDRIASRQAPTSSGLG